MLSLLLVVCTAVASLSDVVSAKLDPDINRSQVETVPGREPAAARAQHEWWAAGSPPRTPRPPRQDPRQFYQSEAYLLEALGRGDEGHAGVGGVYPAARDLARAAPAAPDVQRSSRYRAWSSVSEEEPGVCVRCPAARTLAARARLLAPRLHSCGGGAAPRGVRFEPRRGPALGSLLPPGDHVVVGTVLYKGQRLQECGWLVRVREEGERCALPPALRARCSGARCRLACADPARELLGARELRCGRDLRWSARLPVCRVQNWCSPPPAPENGKLSCQSASGYGANATRLAEGSRCRARCEPGWREAPRGAAVCRRGQWTHALACSSRLPRRRHNFP